MSRSDFNKLVNQVKPSQFLDYRDWLQAAYVFLKSRMDRYSYKKFAEDLGFSANNVLHHIIKGRRPLTKDAVERIISAIAPTSVERAYLRQLVEYNNCKDEKARESALEKLFTLKDQMISSGEDKNSLEFFRCWYHPVIAELVRLEGFKSEPNWISKALNGMVRVPEVKASLELLENMGLIEYNEEQGRHSRTAKDPSTGPQVHGLAVASFHSQMICHARDAIVKVEKSERDISSLTLAVDEDSSRKLRDLLNKFQEDVMRVESESKNPNRIVQLNLQLFPFSKKVSSLSDQQEDSNEKPESLPDSA